jgi:uncharacterized protein (TIGR03435 family)
MRALAGLACIAILSNTALGQAPAFDAADVHRSARATNPYTFMSGGVLRGERYDLRKATMLDLIRIAWAVDPAAVVGGPNWLELDRFDIAAKAPARTPPETVRLMLQALLADRFKLVLHRDTRPMPAFAMTADKGKHKLKQASGAGETGCRYQPQSGPAPETVYVCRNITMAAFAQQLRGIAGDYLTDPVTDSTDLEGAWDFDLKWNPRSQLLPAGSERTTVFDAVARQLGLSLETSNAPAPVIVVDRVNEKPTDNPPGTAQALPPALVEFEVADLKPGRPDERESLSVKPGGGLEARAVLMKILIATAWDIDWDHVDDMIAGAPKWIASARFDIVAKPPAAAIGQSPAGSGFIDDDLRLMLRTLLIERFKIKSQ